MTAFCVLSKHFKRDGAPFPDEATPLGFCLAICRVLAESNGLVVTWEWGETLLVLAADPTYLRDWPNIPIRDPFKALFLESFSLALLFPNIDFLGAAGFSII